MPYDICDAKDDIELLDAKLNEIIRVLKEKKIVVIDEQPKK